jgi:hypothetical protein
VGSHARRHGRVLRNPRHRAGSQALSAVCRLDNGSPEELRQRGFSEPQIVVITGLVKPNATLFTGNAYKKVRKLGDDYLSTLPRRIAS